MPEAPCATRGARRAAHTLRHHACAVAVLVVLALPGCSARQVYDASAGWRRNECSKIGDQEKRERCLKEEAGRSYDDYRAGAASAVSR